MTDIVPLLTHDDTLASKCEVLSRIKGATDVIGDVEDSIRREVEAEIRSLADQAGGTFSFRFGDDGSATIAGGNRKVAVSDADAHRPYAEEHGFDMETRLGVEIRDERAALQVLLDDRPDDTSDPHVVVEMFTKLVESLHMTETVVFAEDHVDRLLERAEPDGDGRLVDVETGEVVPGVSVSYSRDYLQVRTDRPARERTATMLRSRLTPQVKDGQ